MTITGRHNRKQTKTFYYLEWGRGPGERKSLDIFTYTKPKTQLEKNHNKESEKILAVKKSEYILEAQATGSAYVPTHKFKANFLDYYDEYVTANRVAGNRHLEGSLTHFKGFIAKSFISPIDINETLSLQFRQYLTKKFQGHTPLNYFACYKRVVKAATKDGYFRINPVDDVKSKRSPSKFWRDNLEVEDYLKLLKTPCLNEEVREAFIVSCYAGLRWCDVFPFDWIDIKGDQLRTRLIQRKTGEPVWVTIHQIVNVILQKRKARLAAGITTGKIFSLPSAKAANTILMEWCKSAGIDKHITWHCARLSFSILLQDKQVDNATVALLLGHTSTKYVDTIYKRHRPKDQTAVINQLPHVQGPEKLQEASC